MKDVLSLPTILNYRAINKWRQLNLKDIYASYYYVTRVELVSQKSVNAQEAERLIFIFANTFDLLASFGQFEVKDVYPMLQTLKMTVKYLPRSLFDYERSFVDEYILTLVLRN